MGFESLVSRKMNKIVMFRIRFNLARKTSFPQRTGQRSFLWCRRLIINLLQHAKAWVARHLLLLNIICTAAERLLQNDYLIITSSSQITIITYFKCLFFLKIEFFQLYRNVIWNMVYSISVNESHPIICLGCVMWHLPKQ